MQTQPHPSVVMAPVSPAVPCVIGIDVQQSGLVSSTGGLLGFDHVPAAITALLHRARTGLACALFVPGWKREEAHQFWQGYARALNDLSRGSGARLAAKDAASGTYQAPAVLQAAIGLLGDDIERLSRAEVLQRVAEAGIERPFDQVPGLDLAPGELEHGAVARFDAHHEQAADPVQNDSVCHGASVGAQGVAA